YTSDQIAWLNSDRRSGSVFLHKADFHRLIGPDGVGIVHHEDGCQKSDRQHDIHDWSSESNQDALPAWMRHELTRIAGALFHRVLTGHLHVAAERRSEERRVGKEWRSGRTREL